MFDFALRTDESIFMSFLIEESISTSYDSPEIIQKKQIKRKINKENTISINEKINNESLIDSAFVKNTQDIKIERTKESFQKLGLPKNIYLWLPSVQSIVPNMGVDWNDSQKERYLNFMESTKPWQRYLALIELSEKKFLGSETIFKIALNDSKFWIRIRALIGLSGLGYSVEPWMIIKALEKEKEERIANFYKRFIHSPTQAELFVLRSSLGMIGNKARMMVLKSIAKNMSLLSDNAVYIYAAQYDDSGLIRQWSKEQMLKWSRSDLESIEQRFQYIMEHKVDPKLKEEDSSVFNQMGQPTIMIKNFQSY